MTVWLNRDAKCSYDHSMKMEPMFQILRSVNLQKQINQWTNQYQVSQFEILYYGYRSFQTANGIVIVNDENSGNEDKIPDGVAGYEVSLHVPGKDHITPVRYMNKWEKAVVEGNQKKQKKSIQKVGTCVTDSSDGSLYFYIDQNQGWRLKITDAAAGSRFYELEITHDAGSTWDVIHKDPFHGDAGVAEGMIFFDHNLGYIGMGTATGEYSELYITKDGGKNFAKVELPVQDVSEEGINISDYDYMYMPYKDGSAIQLMLGQGNDEQDKRLLFESEDHGETWNYSGFITK